MTKLTYSILLAILTWTTIALIGMVVIMVDIHEEREPWEFVVVAPE